MRSSRVHSAVFSGRDGQKGSHVRNKALGIQGRADRPPAVVQSTSTRPPCHALASGCPVEYQSARLRTRMRTAMLDSPTLIRSPPSPAQEVQHGVHAALEAAIQAQHTPVSTAALAQQHQGSQHQHLPFANAATVPVLPPAPTHPVIASLGRITKAYTQYLEQARQTGRPQALPHAWVRGLRQQLQHVHWLLNHQQLEGRDFGSLGQSVRRLQVVADAAPTLRPLQEAFAEELVTSALRSPTMAHADLGTWSALLHGLVAAGVSSPDMTRLTAWCMTHLDNEPVAQHQASGWATIRPGLCARIVWAVAASQYPGDATPLLRALVTAVTAGSMRLATPAHWGTLLWGATHVQCADPGLVRSLLREGLTALTAAVEASSRQQHGADQDLVGDGGLCGCSEISSACLALAAAGHRVTPGGDVAPAGGISQEQGQGSDEVGLAQWVSAVREWVASGGLEGADPAAVSQLRWAAEALGADLGLSSHTGSAHHSSPSEVTEVVEHGVRGRAVQHSNSSSPPLSASVSPVQQEVWSSLQSGGESDSEGSSSAHSQLMTLLTR